MPFTIDSSLLEQRLIVTVRNDAVARRAGHRHRPSTHRVLGSWLSDARLGADAVPAAVVPDPDADPETFAAAFDAELRAFEAGERLKGEIDDHQLEALARMHAAAEAELAAREKQTLAGRAMFTAREAVVMEVSTATGLAQADVSDRLELATGPARRVGFLRDQVRTGATTLRRACLVLAETASLDDDAVDRVARATLAPTRDGAGLTHTLLRSRLRRAVLAADTDRRAHRRNARERIGVFGQVFDDGTGSLTVVNDAEKIAAALDRADAAARAARARGDERPLDVLRADFLIGAVVNGWPAASDPGFEFTPSPAGRVFVVVPWTTAAGLDDAPCELPGHGWVSAEHAREIITADGSMWQTLLADLPTGRAIALSTKGYRPTRAIIDHVRAVDGICRGPGCEIPARQCDLDHDIPWPDGPTDSDNLTAKHRAHHRVRTVGWWGVERDTEATLTWRTAAGRKYVTYPKDWLDGHRPIDPEPPPVLRPATHDPPPF